MRKKRLRRLVSEYYDGKSRHPERVRELIQTDPEAAAYFQELQALSSQLRSLPSPSVSPDFSVRVMQNVAQLDMERVRPRWQWVGLPAAAAALLVIATVLFFEVYKQDTRSGSNTQSQFTAIDPDVLSEVIVTRIAQGEELPWQGEAFDMFEPNTSGSEVEYEIADASIYSPEVFGRMLATLEEESDFYTVIDSLENGEVGAMRDLLAEYVLEG
ncbi:MAG TPA: hypothetical protein PKY35_10065 [Candidatus Hydrogenedentes bacterium]|nr:hypothetical protein [Candidatus Hydrogenedentota bacterium]HOL77365.1 hypothetical protein [Candidatus Hydrogenedentota bacterium]HPO84817.1 hypothetical protein [Candidatus Hydrogenedentota bacterium]